MMKNDVWCEQIAWSVKIVTSLLFASLYKMITFRDLENVWMGKEVQYRNNSIAGSLFPPYC
jgi:hypothetical protein